MEMWLYNVQSKTNKRVVEVSRKSTGSDMVQENLIQESFTLKKAVKTAQWLFLLPRAVSTVFLWETSSLLMLGRTTVLWSHVGKFYLDMELIWLLMVSVLKQLITSYILYILSSHFMGNDSAWLNSMSL